MNFFHAVFTRVVVESSHPPAAKSMSPGSRGKLLPLICQIQPEPPREVSCLWVGQFLDIRAPVVWVLFKALEPTALFVHSVNASVALNIVAAYTSAADGTWELALA